MSSNKRCSKKKRITSAARIQWRPCSSFILCFIINSIKLKITKALLSPLHISSNLLESTKQTSPAKCLTITLLSATTRASTFLRCSEWNRNVTSTFPKSWYQQTIVVWYGTEFSYIVTKPGRFVRHRYLMVDLASFTPDFHVGSPTI